MAFNKNIPLKSTDDLLLALLRGQRNSFSNQLGDNGQQKNASSFWDTPTFGYPNPHFNEPYPSFGHGNSQTSQDLDKVFRDALGYNDPYNPLFDGNRGSSPTELFGVDKSLGNNKGSSAYGFSYGSGLGKNNGDGDLTNYLGAQLLGWQNDNNMDRAHEAYQNYLNRLMTLDQRSYDSAASQIQRLMAAGVSREAALALVNGSAGAGTTQQSVEGIAPSESRKNEEEINQMQQDQILNPINTAFNAISSVTGVYGAALQGLSIPSIIANNTIANNNAYASDLMRGARDGIGSMNGILSSAQALGQLSKEDTKDADSIHSWFTNPDNQNAAARDFVSSGQLQRLYENPFGRNAVAENFTDMKTPNRIAAELDNAYEHANNLRLDSAVKEAQSYLLHSQTTWQDTANARAELDFIDWQKVHDLATESKMYEFRKQMVECATITSAEGREAYRKRWLANEESQACMALWNLEEYTRMRDVANANYDPDMAAAHYVAEKCGVYDSKIFSELSPVLNMGSSLFTKTARGLGKAATAIKDFLIANPPHPNNPHAAAANAMYGY